MRSDPSESGADAKGLNPDILPVHVGMIMDGNGRWAQKRLMNRIRGHEKGTRTVRDIVSACRELGIQYLTLYAFSTENWGRPQAEVKALMVLLKKFIISEREEMESRDIRLNILGQLDKLPGDIQEEAQKTMDLTRENRSMTLNLALSYGSREEITRAVQSLADQVAQGSLKPGDITEESISAHLYTASMPDPDLIIRTSGEFRLSNFLMWQAAYAEIYITDTLWPDFTREEFIHILKNYQERDRRFGKVKCSTSSDG
ncbi:isoprenyl transferase [Desulfospira joergensenii]|uniref:isoprenyl transferase n=1 Tax=Desulfospira joergensenii TaxID=53329 RepID=UPI0003B492DB|nr:isoprenyl transferase [Desulfospira joergensenii]